MACSRSCAKPAPRAEPAWATGVRADSGWLPMFYTPGLCATNTVGAYHCLVPIDDAACRGGEHGTTCGVWQQVDPARKDPSYAGAVDCVPIGGLFNLCVVPKSARSGPVPGVFFGERPPGFE